MNSSLVRVKHTPLWHGLIAGRGRVLHAGIIGAPVPAATVFNFLQMISQCDYMHVARPLVTGVLLPIPLSLAAGWIVAKWLDG